MVKSAASLSRDRRSAAQLRWRAALGAFVLTNALAYRTYHFWPCLGATSLLMVCAFGFRTGEDEDEAFVQGRGNIGGNIGGNGRKSSARLSAYSVFNEGFQELPGTLNAAGVDRQIRSGGAVAGDDGGEQHGGGGGGGGSRGGYQWGKGNKLG
jgi:hypothetical protein